MSNKNRPQYADQKGTIQLGLNGNILTAEGASVPADATAGYAPGALFFKRAGTVGAALYVNEGTAASCSFKAVPTQATTGTAGLAVTGVAAGYKLARGQLTTVTAADTVVTGLTTVLAAVAVLESDPIDTVDFATCVIGDQAGTPAAGSIIVKTWKVTTGGAGGNPTLVAASVFTKLVNWIAIGV